MALKLALFPFINKVHEGKFMCIELVLLKTVRKSDLNSTSIFFILSCIQATEFNIQVPPAFLLHCTKKRGREKKGKYTHKFSYQEKLTMFKKSCIKQYLSGSSLYHSYIYMSLYHSSNSPLETR